VVASTFRSLREKHQPSGQLSGQAYRLAGNVHAADAGSDSFFVQVDGGEVWLWDIGLNTSYDLFNVVDRATGAVSVALGVGEHTVGVYLREDGTRLDTIQLINTG
jgi:hypothetical protein